MNVLAAGGLETEAYANVRPRSIARLFESPGGEAIRSYQEAGPIASVSRRGLRRQFPPEALLQLKLISIAKSAGFSLEEIAAMFGRNGLPDLPRAALPQKDDAIDLRIRELTALRETLRHVADCPAASPMECPTFRRPANAG